MTWKNSGFEGDLNPWPLRYRCNALPNELSFFQWCHGCIHIFHSFTKQNCMWNLEHFWQSSMFHVNSWLIHAKDCKNPCTITKDDHCGYLLRFHLASDWSRNNKHSRNFCWCSRFYRKTSKKSEWPFPSSHLNTQWLLSWLAQQTWFYRQYSPRAYLMLLTVTKKSMQCFQNLRFVCRNMQSELSKLDLFML